MDEKEQDIKKQVETLKTTMTGLKHKKLSQVKIGDKIIRNICGTCMTFVVTDLTDTIIICGGDRNEHNGWWFDRETGAEIDEDLGWGPPPKMTGSFAVAIPDEEEKQKWGN